MTQSINRYIEDFNSKYSQFSLTQWIHGHPTAVKVLQVVGLVLAGLSALALLAFPWTAPIAVGIGLAGGLSALSSLASWLFLKHVTCAKGDMTVHAYEARECIGGKLYYRGDIPVLELTGSNSSQWGYAHGFLLGPEIRKLKANLDLAVHSILRLPRAPNLPKTLQEIKESIPSEYIKELEGLARGYNAWAGREELTLQDLLLMHLIPDSKHFHPKEFERQKDVGVLNAACTSLLDCDDEGGVIFGRNMDWCPFGEAGSKSLVIVWKEKGIAVLGVPGMIGAVTGWNKDKVALAMNVCPGQTDEVRGMPAILFNRQVLESTRKISTLFLEGSPLGPYHLTIADSEEGKCISFYQDQGAHYSRDLDDEPIQVLNWEYPKCEGGFFDSQRRYELLTDYFDGAKEIEGKHPQLMENALRLAPYVNSWITMHSLVFRPGQNSVKMSWDNGYAASSQPIEAKMTEFFEDPCQ